MPMGSSSSEGVVTGLVPGDDFDEDDFLIRFLGRGDDDFIRSIPGLTIVVSAVAKLP